MAGNFQFLGFEPNEELKTFSKQIFWLIEDKAPSQSAKTATLSKVKDMYSAKIKIHSSSGIFEIDANNVDAHMCVEQVYFKTKTLLKQWAKSRAPELSGGEIA